MKAPVTAEITMLVRVQFDADTWGVDALDEVASDLSLRLFYGNDDFAEETVIVTYTETLDRMPVILVEDCGNES